MGIRWDARRTLMNWQRPFLLYLESLLLPTNDGEIYTVKNPWILTRKSGTLRFSDGFNIYFTEETKSDVMMIAAFALRHCVHFRNATSSMEQDREYWILDPSTRTFRTPTGITFRWTYFDPTNFAETYLYDIHFVDFDLRGKTIIEAGAFVGDTALYYASRGAHVYSFEADPDIYAQLLDNLSLNPELAPRIVPTHAALGADGLVEFPAEAHGRGSLYTLSHKRIRVKSMSIKSILETFKIKNPFLLHLDIKGSEFKVIEEEEISAFSRIRIEYTCNSSMGMIGRRQSLLEKLREYGFKHIRIFKHNWGKYDLENHGTIEASK
jgi:FkbM family methyltransferase